MFELQGKYNSAKIFTDNIDQPTISQIINLLNQESIKNNKIRIMPDCHGGKGCVVGTTMTIQDSVIPNLVGGDIGCGMLSVKLKETRPNLPVLDSVIRKHVPSGGSVHKEPISSFDLSMLRCIKNKAPIQSALALKSLGTLGGGNHFIELGKDSGGSLWLTIHSGSRHLGTDVCKYYQNQAFAQCSGVPFEMAYCSGSLMEDYIHDMKVVQQFAAENRRKMAQVILKNAKLHEIDSFDTVHNYIDTDSMILRKGSISAKADEKVLIPLNMRDGSLVCVGTGNEDWNFSAPHGAGRLMSRADAKSSISVSDYKKTMKDAGIFSTSVCAGTVDESPMAYKPADEIKSLIGDTVKIVDTIIPVYNFKASAK